MIKCSLVTLIFVVVLALASFNSYSSEYRIDSSISEGYNRGYQKHA